MLTFQAIGDGNCLYNSEAILLIEAFKQKELDNLIRNEQYRNQFHQLLKIYEGNGLIKVSHKKTQKAVKDGFSALIKRFTVNDKIDWDQLQEEMATGLREFVQNAIITDEDTKQLVRAELVQAISFSVDMAYEDGQLPEQVNENGIDGSYFEEMTNIKEKILEVLNDPDLDTAELKKLALNQWFFDGEAVGLSDYLQGETGIGNPNIHAADIEIKVLSCKLGIVHRTYMRGQVGNEQPATYYNGFLSDEKSRQVDDGAVLFSLEKSPNHWNALFLDTPANQELLQAREAQIRHLSREDFLKEHGTYAKHCASLEMSEADYCAMYGLTKEQFDRSEITTAQAGNQAKLSKSKTAEPVKKTSSAKNETVNEEPAKSTPDQVTASASSSLANVNVNRRFVLNWFTAGVVIATLAHCFLMPFLKEALFGAVIVPQAGLVLLGITLAISAFGGFFVANRMAAEASQDAEAVVSRFKTPQKNTVGKKVDLFAQAAPTFLLYHNVRSQEAKQAKVAVAERPAGPRQKLH